MTNVVLLTPEKTETDMAFLSQPSPAAATLYRYAVVLALLLLQNSCGYHNPYTTDGRPQEGPTSLHLAVWPNRTNELGLEALFYRSLTGWFKKSGHINLTNDRDHADLLLFGEITTIDLPSVSYGLHDRATEIEVRLTVNLALQSRQAGSILWQEPHLTLVEPFTVGLNSEETRANKEQALARMARNLSETIYLKAHQQLHQ